jgi:aryl-alcohol dehydrogenase-like predicted oxidoreductase
MTPRPLGDTGILVSPLGLGSVKFGRKLGVKYPAPFDLPTDAEIKYLLDEALAMGINVIDTAPAYGCSEQRIGQLLKKKRPRFCLVTKVGEEFENGKSTYDFSANHIRFSIERSMQRLRTDFLDVVLIHSDGNDMEIIQHSDAIPTLQSLQQKGLIRAIGMSTKTVRGGLAALRLMDVAMVTYNLAETGEKPVLEFANQANKGILIKKALASGHLCPPGEHRPVTENFRHVFAQPGVSTVIVGSINPAHLRANTEAVTAVLGH